MPIQNSQTLETDELPNLKFQSLLNDIGQRKMRTTKIPIVLALTAGVIAGLAVSPAAQAQNSKKPNVILIVTDDIAARPGAQRSVL